MSDAEARRLDIPWPRTIDGTEITKAELQMAYEEIIQPEQIKQRAGVPMTPAMHVMLAAFRSIYGEMPEEVTT